MTQKIAALVFLNFVFAVGLIAQVPDSLEQIENPEILIVHTNGIKSPRQLKKYEHLKIFLSGEDEPFIGKGSYLSDTSMLVSGKEIKFSEIESMRVTRRTGIIFGGVLLAGGLATSGFGAIIVYTFQDITDVTAFLGTLFGGGIIIVGGCITLIGTALIAGSTKVYDMEKWHFYVKQDT